MTYVEAKEKAEKYLKSNYGFILSRAAETKDVWIFSGCYENEHGFDRTKFNVEPIMINKSNGELKTFKLPSSQGFEIIKDATVIFDKERN